MTTDEPDWWSTLRELDEPVPPVEYPGVESFLQPVAGEPGRFVLMESAALAALRARAAQPGEHTLEVHYL